jgi:hypothetical protein
LPPLTADEIAEIADAYILTTNTVTDAHHEGPIRLEQTHQLDSDNSIKNTASASLPVNNEVIGPRPPSESHESPSTNLDVIEQRALIKAINDRPAWGAWRSVTPRAIQSLLLRYQLARYLLMLQQVPFVPYDLAKLLIIGGSNHGQATDESYIPTANEIILSTVRRVSI